MAARRGEVDHDHDVLAEIMLRGSFDTAIEGIDFEDDGDRLLPPVSLPRPRI